MLVIWSLVPLPFLNPACTCGSSCFTYCWSLAWRILSITLLVCDMSAVVQLFEWIVFSIALLWDWNENWPFPVLWPLPSFPTLQAYWLQHFNSIIFRVLSSLAGFLSPPLALFLVMLPKAHLTSHSSMFGSRWVTPPLQLSGSLRSKRQRRKGKIYPTECRVPKKSKER